MGTTNPIATILSAALLLRYSLGLTEAARAIETAVAAAIEVGARTADITANRELALSTHGMGDAIIAQLA